MWIPLDFMHTGLPQLSITISCKLNKPVFQWMYTFKNMSLYESNVVGYTNLIFNISYIITTYARVN